MMRLTLRTLIAWLDDTLTPTEVRTIGQQVSESPFAKELVERVQRVTRQRRLTYPGDSGTAPLDPNLVAAYLDNELPADQVAEYEKICLTADVSLAEVASVHQVLSLIGQKAKVPPDAKLRMYRLVRGRETTKPAVPPKPKPASTSSKRPVIEPISSWSSAVSTRQSRVERFGPAAVVLAAIGLLGWAAVYSLKSDPLAGDLARNNGPNNPDRGLNLVPLAQPPVPIEPVKPVKVETLPATEPPVKPEPSRPEPNNSEEIGSFDAVQGVILRSLPDANAWDRVEAKAPVKDTSKVLNLAPFRNNLKLGKDEVDLVDSTEVLLEGAEGDHSTKLELKRGQVVIRPGSGSLPFPIRFEGQILAISGSAGLVVGVERIPTLLPGQSEPAPARLRLYVPDGRAVFKVGDLEETINGPGEISLQKSGTFTEKARQPVPAWVTESAPSGFSKEVGDQFVALLRPGRPILADLVEAMDDPQKDVKRMAILALGAIGSVEQVVEVVSRKEEPTVHRAGVEALKTSLALGGESARSVREALVRQYDRNWAEVTERLLVGFRPEDAKDEATLAKLVEYLSTAPTRGTRQLALDNLRMLTGRDTLEYDADSPEGKGLKAWQDLVKKKESGKEGRQSNPGNR